MRHFIIKNDSVEILPSLQQELINFPDDQKFNKAAIKIHQFLISNKLNPKLISFNYDLEGFQKSIIDFLNGVIEILVNSYKYDLNKFVYVSGSCPIDTNIVFYNSLPFEFLPKKIELRNTFEGSFFDPRINRDVKINVKPKKFLSMNGIPRFHRRIATSFLIQHNLLKDSFYSLDTSNYEPSYDAEKYSSIAPDLTKEFKPMFLSKMPGDTNDRIKDEDIHYFENSYFSLVQESFFDNTVTTDFRFYENIFLSEKTYRPIYFKHPFILLGVKGSLAALKDHGYETFSPMIDESYDNIDNPVIRLHAALDEVKRLCSLTEDQWVTFQHAISPIVEYNYNKLASWRGKYLSIEGYRK